MSNFTCKALQVQQPNALFYVASVSAEDLKTICRPLKSPKKTGGEQDAVEPQQLSKDELDQLLLSLQSPKFQKQGVDILSEKREEPYQRFLDERRSLEIANYLKESNALLPNSIILAVNTDLEESLILKRFTADLVEINLPREQSSAVILDGQHRVEAFSYLPTSVQQDFQVVVTFLIGIPFYQQAELFAVINGKQKPVNKSIIYDLLGYAPIDGDSEHKLYEGILAVSRFCGHSTRILNNANQSPWNSRIKMRGPGDSGLISQAAVVDYLTPMVQPKKYTARLKTLPVLFEFFKDSDSALCSALIIVYISAIKSAQPEQWRNENSLLWKNTGVAIMFRLLHDEIIFAGGAKEMMRSFQKIVTRWQEIPAEKLQNSPKSGGGGLQNEIYEEFRQILFTSEELNSFSERRDAIKDKLIESGGLIK